MNVLVTGSNGFIGSHLLEYLDKLHYNVVGIDRTYPHIEEKTKKLNITHVVDLEDLFAQCKFDKVIHLAAVGSVPKSFDHPYDTLNSNIIGFSNILQLIVKYKVPKLVYASSSSVYGDSKEKVKYEGQEGAVLSPYAMTKLNNELMAEMWANRHDFKAIGLRFFNVFGPRQKHDLQYGAVVPRFIHALKRGEQLSVFGDGNQSRDFTYVRDVVEACFHASITDVPKNHDVFNVGAGNSTSIYELYYTIGTLLKLQNRGNIKLFPARKGDVLHSTANIEKIKKLLNWAPKYSVFDGIKETINHY